VNFNIFFVFTYSSLQLQYSTFHLLIIIEWQERIPSSPWHPIFQTPPKRTVRLFFIVKITYLTRKLINNENYEHFSLITTFLSKFNIVQQSLFCERSDIYRTRFARPGELTGRREKRWDSESKFNYTFDKLL
jgi:hypothetical protein